MLVLYTITFKSGARQEVDLTQEEFENLRLGVETAAKGEAVAVLSSPIGTILLNEVVCVHRFVGMREKYEL
jgi:hypothetical protein